MKTALFASYENIASIKRNLDRDEHNYYTNRVYEMTSK